MRVHWAELGEHFGKLEDELGSCHRQIKQCKDKITNSSLRSHTTNEALLQRITALEDHQASKLAQKCIRGRVELIEHLFLKQKA